MLKGLIKKIDDIIEKRRNNIKLKVNEKKMIAETSDDDCKTSFRPDSKKQPDDVIWDTIAAGFCFEFMLLEGLISQKSILGLKKNLMHLKNKYKDYPKLYNLIYGPDNESSLYVEDLCEVYFDFIEEHYFNKTEKEFNAKAFYNFFKKYQAYDTWIKILKKEMK